MSASDSYRALAERLGFPESESLHQILEYMMSADAARIAEALPGTVAEVAEKTGFDASRVRQELEDLFVKGVAFPRGDYNHREYFRFTRGITQFHDSAQSSACFDHVKDRKFYELWHHFITNELIPWFIKMRQTRPASFRVVPAIKSIRGLEGLLPYENYAEMMKQQTRIATVKCPCRYCTTAVGEHCEHTNEEDRWNCVQFGRGADYSMARGAGKDFTAEEAIQLAEQMEDDGLIHLWVNNSTFVGANFSCNCCRDCCIEYVSMDRGGLSIGTTWEKSRFTAYLASTDACDGCQDCVDRCQFDAIAMEKMAGSKRLKAVVDQEKCWGCGVCVVKCEPATLKMKIIRPVEHIPLVGGAVQ